MRSSRDGIERSISNRLPQLKKESKVLSSQNIVYLHPFEVSPDEDVPMPPPTTLPPIIAHNVSRYPNPRERLLLPGNIPDTIMEMQKDSQFSSLSPVSSIKNISYGNTPSSQQIRDPIKWIMKKIHAIQKRDFQESYLSKLLILYYIFYKYTTILDFLDTLLVLQFDNNNLIILQLQEAIKIELLDYNKKINKYELYIRISEMIGYLYNETETNKKDIDMPTYKKLIKFFKNVDIKVIRKRLVEQHNIIISFLKVVYEMLYKKGMRDIDEYKRLRRNYIYFLKTHNKPANIKGGGFWGEKINPENAIQTTIVIMFIKRDIIKFTEIMKFIIEKFVSLKDLSTDIIAKIHNYELTYSTRYAMIDTLLTKYYNEETV
jgi:hypothetical protein